MSNSLAAIHVAKKQLGLEEDVFRDVCERVTGKRSTRDMSEPLRVKLVEHFREQGFKPVSKSARKSLEGKFAAKLQALWIAGWNLGVFRSNDDKAMIAFVQRQTGLNAVRFVHYWDDAAKAIEGIKGWIERKVGPVWREPAYRNTWRKTDGGMIAAVQWSILSQHCSLPEPGGFDVYVRKLLRKDDAFQLSDMTASEWQIVMNTLGHLVRKVSIHET